MRHCALFCWCVGAVLLAGRAPARAADGPADTFTRAEPFAFGVEYLVPGLARTYAATGATWGKNQPAGFDWDSIEPDPPVGGKHTYRWSYTDRLIREYQDAGFCNFHIYTQVRNRWAGTMPALEVGGHASLPPKPAVLHDYAAYLRALVERYGGRGPNAMPGLRWPIHYWEVEAEWSTFWHGSVPQYLELLRLAHKTIKQADPQAKVVLQGILLMGVFDGDPDEQELQRRLHEPFLGPARRRYLRDVGELLKHPELFDAVEFHSLGDWTEIAATARYLRAQMAGSGYQKPLWVGDINFTLNPMIWWNKPYYPYRPEQRAGIVKWIEALKSGKDPAHDEALRWFRAEQASFTAKKLISALGCGLAGANVGNLEDWPQLAILHGVTGTGGFCGLIDTKGFDPAGKLPLFERPRVPGDPRPAYWTLKLLTGRLGPYSRVTKLSLGRGVLAYRFSAPFQAGRAPASTVALWYDDARGDLPGDPPAQVPVSLATAAERARLVPMVTAIGKQEPAERPAVVRAGRISLSLGKTPVMIEEYTQ